MVEQLPSRSIVANAELRIFIKATAQVPEFLLLLSLVIGSISAFAALLRVAIQNLSGPPQVLALLASGASILNAGLCTAIRHTSVFQIYTRFFIVHTCGALMACSLLAGLTSMWH